MCLESEGNMSRTYRKNPRSFVKYNGLIMNGFRNDVTSIAPKVKDVLGVEYVEGMNFFQKIVTVPEVNCYSLPVSKKDKQRHHQIDRRRQKNALHKEIYTPENEGAVNNWVPSFNPRDFD